GVVVMFSSTMVVIKVLSDKKQLDTLHGRIIIGTLLMQDVVAVMLLSVLSHVDQFSAATLIVSIAKAALVFVVAWLFSKFLFPQLFKFAAKTQELFFLLSISVCFLFSLAFVKVGFSIAIGAFVGGLMLGNLPYNLDIISKIKSLRDFFATLFFVSMGAKLTLNTLQAYTVPFLVMLFATVIFLPFITFLTTMMFGFNRRVAFLTALSLSQISEFALIAVDQGLRLGHVDQGFLSLTIMTALTSIIITSYLVKYEDSFYSFMKPFLKLFDRFSHKKRAYEHDDVHVPHKVVIVGFDRIGYSVSKTLEKIEDDVLIVDFNPDIIDHLMREKIPCMYGDIGDDEVLDKLFLEQVRIIISTIPTLRDNLLLVRKVRHLNKDAKVIMTAYMVDDALELYNAGADYVILPHLLGGHHAGLVLEDISKDLDSLILTRLNHINELRAHQARHRPHFFRDNNL
ncbi:MAG: cation:proton antiporter, partial [Nanoarchaeota archaeon]|nr:cation:proton antiporter [Nanoarchaeota archaeon]